MLLPIATNLSTYNPRKNTLLHFFEKASVIFCSLQDATCAISFLPWGLKSPQQCLLHQGLRGSSAAKHLSKPLKLSLCIALLKEVKKHECTLKCTEFLYKHLDDLHSKVNWRYFYTRSYFSLEMSFPLTAKSFDFSQEQKQQTPQSQDSNRKNYWFFEFSHNIKNYRNFSWSLFLLLRGKKSKTINPRSEFKKRHENEDKKICGVLFVCFSCFVVHKPIWKFWRLDMVLSQSPLPHVQHDWIWHSGSLLWKGNLQSLLSGAVNDCVTCKVLESPPEIPIPFYLAQSDMCQGLLYIPRGASNITMQIRVFWNLIKCPRNGPA